MIIGNKTVSSDSVCNHTRNKQMDDFSYHSCDFRPSWTSLSPITITYLQEGVLSALVNLSDTESNTSREMISRYSSELCL